MDELEIRQASYRGLGRVVKVLHEATILREGWEMDHKGWVVELEDGSIRGITTNHGGVCSWSVDEAMESMNEALKAAESLSMAVKMLK